MIINKFFKVPKPKRFEYAPKYYDQQKEELEERIKAIKEQQDTEGEAAKYRLGKFFQSRRRTSFIQKQKQQSNVRLIVIIIVLFLLIYLIMK